MEWCFIDVAKRMGTHCVNNAFVSVRACNIWYSCARRVPDVRPCAARVGAAWYRVQQRGTTWHRVGRAIEHDVALRATRPCYLWEPVCGASSDVSVWYGLLVMRCIVNWSVRVAKNTRVCDETSRASAPHARARSVQHTDENKAEQHRMHTRAMRSRRKGLRVWLAWCDGTTHT